MVVHFLLYGARVVLYVHFIQSFGSTYFIVFNHNYFDPQIIQKYVLQYSTISLQLIFLTNFYFLVSNFLSFCLHYLAWMIVILWQVLGIKLMSQNVADFFIVSAMLEESIHLMNWGSGVLHMFMQADAFVVFCTPAVTVSGRGVLKTDSAALNLFPSTLRFC